LQALRSIKTTGISFFWKVPMNRLLATLAASVFAFAAQAQTAAPTAPTAPTAPAAPAAAPAPMAAPAPAAAPAPQAKATKTHKVAKSGHKKVAKKKARKTHAKTV
jgi:hypothetical protein